MNEDQDLAARSASLRAGVAGTVMIVVLCFCAALILSDMATLP